MVGGCLFYGLAMANHKSASKAHRRSIFKGALNTAVRSRIKTYSTKVRLAIGAGNLESVHTAFRVAESEIMKSVTKGVLKLNTASRRVSKLAREVKAFEGSA